MNSSFNLPGHKKCSASSAREKPNWNIFHFSIPRSKLVFEGNKFSGVQCQRGVKLVLSIKIVTSHVFLQMTLSLILWPTKSWKITFITKTEDIRRWVWGCEAWLLRTSLLSISRFITKLCSVPAEILVKVSEMFLLGLELTWHLLFSASFH